MYVGRTGRKLSIPGAGLDDFIELYSHVFSKWRISLALNITCMRPVLMFLCPVDLTGHSVSLCRILILVFQSIHVELIPRATVGLCGTDM
jgi:hypothetical protein